MADRQYPICLTPGFRRARLHARRLQAVVRWHRCPRVRFHARLNSAKAFAELLFDQCISAGQQ